MIKRTFLIIGIFSFLAAALLTAAKGKGNPLSPERKWWLANKEQHGTIFVTRFSPDGEKLFLSVRNESGVNSTRDTYIYTVNERAIKKLNINMFDGYVSWSPDSRFLTFNQPRDENRYLHNGIVYDTELNTVSERFKLPFGGWDQPWSPDGKWQIFEGGLCAYMKRTGKPVWVDLPIKPNNGIPYWNYNGTILIWCQPDKKKINRYHVNEQILDESIYAGDFETSALMYCSSYANDIFMLTSRKSEQYGRVVVRKLDLDSGQFTYSFDSGYDFEKQTLGHRIFIAPDDILYFMTSYYTIKGKEPAELPELLKLNIKTNQTEILLKGNYRVGDYCGKRDLFSLSSKADDHKILYLFEAKTRSFERIFPANNVN